jgi:hypothetical protein
MDTVDLLMASLRFGLRVASYALRVTGCSALVVCCRLILKTLFSLNVFDEKCKKYLIFKRSFDTNVLLKSV